LRVELFELSACLNEHTIEKKIVSVLVCEVLFLNVMGERERTTNVNNKTFFGNFMHCEPIKKLVYHCQNG
jgi:hypothetical protein